MRWRAEWLLLLVLAAAVTTALGAASHWRVVPPEGAEQVVLLHGFGRSSRAMFYLEHRLLDAGYEVHNIDYASRAKAPEALVEDVAKAVAERVDPSRPVHFVTYSLGSLLARAYLADRPLARIGRVVMLGPPNQGTPLADDLEQNSLADMVLGPTASALGTAEEDFPKQLGAPYYEVGIIAGNASINPIGSRMIPGEDDGTVAVESTRLEGMKDHLVVPVTHSFLVLNRNVADQVLAFLERGRFNR